MNEAENHTNIVEVEFDTVMNVGVKDIDETEFFVEETQDFNEANIDYIENNNEQDDCGFVDENGQWQDILLEVYKESHYSVTVDDNIFKEITGKSNEVENDTNRFDNDNVSDSISQQLA